MTLSRLYARLCHAFLVIIFNDVKHAVTFSDIVMKMLQWY